MITFVQSSKYESRFSIPRNALDISKSSRRMSQRGPRRFVRSFAFIFSFTRKVLRLDTLTQYLLITHWRCLLFQKMCLYFDLQLKTQLETFDKFVGFQMCPSFSLPSAWGLGKRRSSLGADMGDPPGKSLCIRMQVRPHIFSHILIEAGYLSLSVDCQRSPHHPTSDIQHQIRTQISRSHFPTHQFVFHTPDFPPPF